MPRRRGDPWRTPDGMTAQSLRSLRDRRFRRSPAHRVHGEREALTFVREVGFCSTFYRFPEGVACLWEAVAGRANPRWPRHSHHDAGIGLTWELKDTLPARKRVYYGKLLKGRPLLVALDLFPAFYALVRGRQRARDYRLEYEAGRLSHTARRIMDAMTREHPQYTRELRANVFMLEPAKTRGFERAMAELQQGLWLEFRRVLFRSDRKSTRLNSSHGYISYAVFCLEKKKKGTQHDKNLLPSGILEVKGIFASSKALSLLPSAPDSNLCQGLVNCYDTEGRKNRRA